MSKKLTYEYVKKYFEDHSCELLEEEYKNNKIKMRYRCICGNASKIGFTTFREGHRCKKCGSEKCGEKNRNTFEYIYNYFKDQKCELLEKTYKHNKIEMRYHCSCGDVSKINFNRFVKGVRCKKCGIEKRSGENNPNYNPNLTDKDRGDRRKILGYTIWTRNIYKKNNYTCQKCLKRGSIKLNAHHIQGYASNKSLRIDKNNGITLCEQCHNEFHKKYGYKNNNRTQLDEFFKILILDT